MIYYILGILAVIIVHLITFLKSYEHENKVNYTHIFISVIFSMYMVYIVEMLHNYVVPNGIGLMKVAGLFVPIGVFMPMIYRRYKSFLIDALFVAVIMAVIMVLQEFYCENSNILNLLFAVFGVLLGYIIFAIVNEAVPGLRDKLIIKRRKNQSAYFSFEPEIFILALFFLFFAVIGIEKITGENIVETLKGTAENTENDKYKGIYYADKHMYSRYNAYGELNSNMSLEEIVWRVDANLDQEFYDEKYVTIADEKSQSPLLINKFNRVSEYYKPKTLVSIEGNYVSTPATAEAYHDMIEEMKELGMKIYIISSYRDIPYQEKLYNNYINTDSQEEVDTYSARPGFSEHHTGRALDISQVPGNLNAFEGSKEAEWIYENCYKYGFIVRYKKEQMDVTGYIFEPWHITYVGKNIAQTMKNEGIETLEEYVVKYIDYEK